MRVDYSRPSMKKELHQTKFGVSAAQILELLRKLSDTVFEFDGVVYDTKLDIDKEVRKASINRLLSMSRPRTSPIGNKFQYLFIYEDGGKYSTIITSDKHWKAKRTVFSLPGRRYDLLVVEKRIRDSGYATSWFVDSHSLPSMAIPDSSNDNQKQ